MYPAAGAAPLSRGDNGWRITLYTTIDSNTCKVALPRVPSSEGYGEAGGYEKDADRTYPAAGGKHSLDVCSPLKRIKDVQWTYVLARDAMSKDCVIKWLLVL